MAENTETVVKPLSADDIKTLLDAALKPLSAEVTKLQVELDARSKAMEKTERDTILAQAASQGKVMPLSAATLEAMPLAQVKELVAGLKPNVVPLTAKLRVLNADGAKPEKKTLRDSANAFDADIQRQSGITAHN